MGEATTIRPHDPLCICRVLRAQGRAARRGLSLQGRQAGRFFSQAELTFCVALFRVVLLKSSVSAVAPEEVWKRRIRQLASFCRSSWEPYTRRRVGPFELLERTEAVNRRLKHVPLSQKHPEWYGFPPAKRNLWEPQIVPPQKVDMPRPKETIEEVAVPASINGRSLADGRP